ncbi:MAG: hypothetical protein DI629_12210 [Mesorhizobium amorphae]|nr:MAG: hypothetical protein DI629_12210 [Mesorhizobium amorphae]
MADLAELIERVEKLEGPDRHIDVELALLKPWPAHQERRRVDQAWCIGVRFQGKGWIEPAEPATSSLDAAVSLVNRVLPGWYWGISVEPPVHGKRFHAVVNNIPVWSAADNGLVQSADYAPSAALAITLATLKAKQAMESGNG